ncbi:ComEC/Rec2 family competence protein [Kiloniella sp.]|uniref:ComEC/Rec2 family competence protein n=1 Tax=Kiloniella sp. TaxID=1938587 RepID=UPI003B020D6A
MEAAFEHERTRLLNWLPVFVALGIAFYFSLPYEPNIYLVSAISLTLWICVVLGRNLRNTNAKIWLGIVTLTLLSSGVSLATVRSLIVQAPVLNYEIGPRFLEGSILSIEPLSPGQRYIIGNLDARGFNNQPTPKYIRLRSNIRQNGIEVGDKIRARVVVKPPTQPVIPSGFNFARYAYYKQIGGVGYIWGKVERVEADINAASQFNLFWNDLRNKLVSKISNHLEGDERALAITFLTGQKGSISRKAKDNIRKSGLAHLLAISGLHMGLVAGIIFFSLRLVMASISSFALNYPIKKISAVLTLFICYGYLELIGMPLSAQRAYMMAGVSLLAIVLDRQAISMRTVSVAALVLLILTPEVLISASFQLSFAAVIALVAVFEYYDQRERSKSFMGRVLAGLKVTIICSFVASLATAPFVLYHFHSLPLYGILANLFAVPFTGLVLMPLVLLSYLLIPFGLEAFSLIPLGWAFDLLLWLSKSVASIPMGQMTVSAFPVIFLALVSIGGIWLCLIKSRIRLLGGIPVVVFILLVGLGDRGRDILIDGKTGLIAIKRDNELYLNLTKRSRFTAKVWKQDLAVTSIRDWHELPEVIFRCDARACLYKTEDKTISFVLNGTAFYEDCLRADYIITTVKSPSWCRGKENLVLDYWDLRKKGAHSLAISGSNIEIVNVRATVGDRPWAR